MYKLRKCLFRLQFVLLGTILAVAFFVACTPSPQVEKSLNSAPAAAIAQDIELATKIGKEIIAACPVVADPKNLEALQNCADRLTNLASLRDAMDVPFLWGQQGNANKYVFKDIQTTEFDPLVWRRTYLATFMFEGNPRVEPVNDLVVLHLPAKFRNQLDIGAYPYPFWHSAKKWEDYQTATELIFVIEQGKLKGSLRSAERDPKRPKVALQWDGQWTWNDSKGTQPYVTLYSHLFSKSNPYVANLDKAYRAFAEKMRPHSCFVCHSPQNSRKQNPLLLLNYPNQALTLRHETVRQIEEKHMPPRSGIRDDKERQVLVELARAFAEAGDKALAFEGEKIAPEKS